MLLFASHLQPGRQLQNCLTAATGCGVKPPRVPCTPALTYRALRPDALDFPRPAQVQEPLRKCRALHAELAALQGVMAGAMSTLAFNASAAAQLDDAARRLERRLRRVIALLDSCAAEVLHPGSNPQCIAHVSVPLRAPRFGT